MMNSKNGWNRIKASFLLRGLLWCLCLMHDVSAGVRVLPLDGPRMGAIFLKLGQSTVLRFPEKPKKVVVGNKNFFNVEFIYIYSRLFLFFIF